MAKKTKEEEQDLATLQKAVTEVSQTVKKGDLYYALKHVGDDPVKSMIEDALEELLSPEDFKKVLAVFTIITDDKVFEKYFGKIE